MIKMLHLLLVTISITGFIGRIILSETQSPYVKHKFVVVFPHVVNGLLLLSGFTLVFQGQWLAGEYGWIVVKILALLGYIALATVAMRQRGRNRWLAFFGAMACFTYIAIVAVTKNALFFL